MDWGSSEGVEKRRKTRTAGGEEKVARSLASWCWKFADLLRYRAKSRTNDCSLSERRYKAKAETAKPTQAERKRRGKRANTVWAGVRRRIIFNRNHQHNFRLYSAQHTWTPYQHIDLPVYRLQSFSVFFFLLLLSLISSSIILSIYLEPLVCGRLPCTVFNFT